MTSICADCGVDTTPCTGKRGCRHKGRWQWYMVTKALWKRAGMKDGFLCIPCLEARIGRPLKPRDFTKWPVNDLNAWDTDLIWMRKTGEPIEERRLDEALDRLWRRHMHRFEEGEHLWQFVSQCAGLGDKQAAKLLPEVEKRWGTPRPRQLALALAVPV